jgi:crotonobetainyl-CoA:carnitine CoA-transferase CaiB-like acyl-CoA transferase
MSDETRRTQPLPLEGIRVLELSHIVAGPSGGVILGDLGADVIKIEHPEVGDTARGQANEGSTFYTFNRNKKYLALDLRQPAGKQVFERLVARSDVVFDNFAPGALDRLGLGYEWGRKANPRIVYCSVKGFLPGPYSDRPFLDELAQMAGGLAYLTGLKDQPMRAGASITDIGAATYGVIGVLAALLRRQSTGVGEHVEAGLYETIVFWVSQYITGAQLTGKDALPRGQRNSGMGDTMGWGVYRLFPTRDGTPVFIAVTGNRHWAGLCDALGFDDWKDHPDFSNNRKRSAQRPRIAERVTEAVATMRYEEITRKLYERRIPFAPVNTPMGLLSDRQMNEANRWLELSVPGHRFKVPKLPIDLAATRDFAVREQPAPIGRHTDDILAELGYSPQEIERLKAEKVVVRSERMLTDMPAE